MVKEKKILLNMAILLVTLKKYYEIRSSTIDTMFFKYIR